MDPVALVVAAVAGALIAGAGFGAGYLVGRRSRKTSRCEGCGHGLSYHKDGGKCHATDRRAKYSGTGGNLGLHDFPCTCQQYVGDVPADRMLASFTHASMRGVVIPDTGPAGN